jgi:hypothetical protein
MSGLTFSVAGRFNRDFIAYIVRRAAKEDTEHSYGGWAMAYCYGTLLQRAGGICSPRGRFDLRSLAEVKTDMVIVHLYEKGDDNDPERKQPFVRHDQNGAWAFCYDGTVARPELLQTGERIVTSTDPSERLFLHALGSFDADDPVETLRKVHLDLDHEPEQGLFLMSPDVLVASSWHEGEDAEGEARLWIGRTGLLRLMAPFPLESLERCEWEPVPNRTVVAMTRFRHEGT